MTDEHDDDYHADDDDFCDRMQPGDQMISYNLRKDERPGGLKVRFKINVVSGERAKAINARQAEAILDLLRWCQDHRKQQEQAQQDQAGPAGTRPRARPPARKIPARNEKNSECQEREKTRKYKTVIRREWLIMPG